MGMKSNQNWRSVWSNRFSSVFVPDFYHMHTHRNVYGKFIRRSTIYRNGKSNSANEKSMCGKYVQQTSFGSHTILFSRVVVGISIRLIDNSTHTPKERKRKRVGLVFGWSSNPLPNTWHNVCTMFCALFGGGAAALQAMWLISTLKDLIVYWHDIKY